MNAFDFLKGLKPIVFSGSEFEVSGYGTTNSEMVLMPRIEYGVETEINTPTLGRRVRVIYETEGVKVSVVGGIWLSPHYFMTEVLNYLNGKQ